MRALEARLETRGLQPRHIGLQVRSSISCTPTCPGARAAFDAVGLAEAPEPALTIVTPHFAAAECSGRAAARFVGAVLLPRVRALVKPASRALFHVALSLIAHHPRALGDALLLPLTRSQVAFRPACWAHRAPAAFAMSAETVEAAEDALAKATATEAKAVSELAAAIAADDDTVGCIVDAENADVRRRATQQSPVRVRLRLG